MLPRLLALIVLLNLPLAAFAAQDATTRPNFVFILADDLGWRDLSDEGSRFYESPHIDRIAAEGMRFTQGYATCQVCSPSRSSIMTGKYPARIGITEWIGARAGADWKRNTPMLPAIYRHSLPAAETTIAEALKAAGYRTFFAGKWHLGGEGSLPQNHGFDINQGGHHRGSPPGGFFSPYENPELEDGPVGEQLPLRLGQETARFIASNRNQPFFAFLSFYSVHAPIQSTRKLWEKYRAKAALQPTPTRRFIIDRTTPVRQVQDHPLYAGMIESMDEAVGLVLQTLDRLGLEDNTVVIFTSDNGGVSAGDGKATSNLPLRGGKGRQWEGGIREPYYIKWPGVVRGGSQTNIPATGCDFFPTVLEMAGLPLQPQQHVDGISLVPTLQGDTLPERPLFWHYPHYSNQGGDPSSIIRLGDWKLIYYHEDERNELYNLLTDPSEQTDLAQIYPGVVDQLSGQLQEWLAAVDAKLPYQNPDFDPVAFEKERGRIRDVMLPNLERQAAEFLDPAFEPSGGWWGSKGGG